MLRLWDASGRSVSEIDMIVKVTRKDIRDAVNSPYGYDSASCPVARAMERHGLAEPDVNPADGKLFYGGDYNTGAELTRLKVPRSVARFVKAFDKKYDVVMFTPEERLKASSKLIRPFSFLVRKER